jgi:siroheme synthase (precorrin-2 oxidase/ferrochelatase)
VLSQVKTYYASHRTTSDDGLNFVGSDRYRLQTVLIEASTTAPPICARIAQAAAEKGWLILTFHDFTNDATTTASFTCPAAVFRAILDCATTTPGLAIVTVKQAVDAIRCGGP